MCRVMYVLIVCGLCSGIARPAEIFRCVGASGEPSYRQQPCDAATAIGSRSAPAVGPAQGLRASERAWLDERHARRRQQTRPSNRSAARPAARHADRQAYRCRNKRRALDAVKAKLRRGYKPSQGDKLRRRRRAHEDYLSTFCS